MRNKYLVAVLLVCLVIALPAIASAKTEYNCSHNNFPKWDTKIEPTCMSAGEQIGRCATCFTHSYRDIGPGDHVFLSATCTTPKICKFGCGTTTGFSLGHSYAPATCLSPRACVRCGVTTGGFGKHKYSGGTCVVHPVCSVCEHVSQGYGEHKYTFGNCTQVIHCLYCGDSKKGNHVWIRDGNIETCRYCQISIIYNKPSEEVTE